MKHVSLESLLGVVYDTIIKNINDVGTSWDMAIWIRSGLTRVEKGRGSMSRDRPDTPPRRHLVAEKQTNAAEVKVMRPAQIATCWLHLPEQLKNLS